MTNDAKTSGAPKKRKCRQGQHNLAMTASVIFGGYGAHLRCKKCGEMVGVPPAPHRRQK